MSAAASLRASRLAWIALALAGLGAVAAAADAAYVAPQAVQALVLRFGAPVRVVNGVRDRAPGLYLKWPVIEEAVRFDKGVQALRAPEVEVAAADGTRFSVSPLMAFRIVDPLAFYRAGPAAHATLERVAGDGLKAALAGAPAQAILGGDGDARALDVARTAVRAAGLGVEVVDLRPDAGAPADAAAAAAREDAAATNDAQTVRAEGRLRVAEVEADAAQQAAAIRGAGEAEALTVRGRGDAERAALLGDAYGKDPAFARFLRQLDAYDGALDPSTTTFVIAPGENAFLKTFADGPGAAATTAKK